MAQQAVPLNKAAARATGSPRSARRGRLAHTVGRAVVAWLLNGLTATTLFAAFPGANGEIVFDRVFPAQGAAPEGSELFTIIPHGPAGPHGERRLTATHRAGGGQGHSSAACYSPDGALLAYTLFGIHLHPSAFPGGSHTAP